MQREITYEWSQDLIRVAVRRFAFRYAGGFFIGCAICLVLGTLGLIFDNGNVVWLIVTIPPLIFGLLWVQYYFRALKTANEMRGLRVTIRFDDDSITFQTPEHSSTMKWSLIKKLWGFPEVLLVFTYGRWNYSMIPVSALDDELRNYIEQKVRDNGGKVE